MKQLKSCIKKSNINLREDLNHMCNAHEGAIEQGKEIGRNSQKLESAKKLLMIGASIEMVVKGIGLSHETVEKLYKEIKH